MKNASNQTPKNIKAFYGKVVNSFNSFYFRANQSFNSLVFRFLQTNIPNLYSVYKIVLLNNYIIFILKFTKMKKQITGSAILILMCFLMACDAEETQIVPSEAFVRDEAMTMGVKNFGSSQVPERVELAFFDCESEGSSHPAFLDVVCDSEELSAQRTVGIIRSNPCKLFSGCYPGLKLNIKDFIVLTLSAKADARINIFSESGKLAASSLKKYGGSGVYDEKTGKMTFSFGVVNEELFSHPMSLQVSTSYHDLKGNLIEIEEKIEIEKDFLQL